MKRESPASIPIEPLNNELLSCGELPVDPKAGYERCGAGAYEPAFDRPPWLQRPEAVDMSRIRCDGTVLGEASFRAQLGSCHFTTAEGTPHTEIALPRRGDIVWSDAARETCYSASFFMRGYIVPGESCAPTAFLKRSRPVPVATGGVKIKYGIACSRALGQFVRVEALEQLQADPHDAPVIVEAQDRTEERLS